MNTPLSAKNICPNCGCDIDEMRKMLPDWTTCEECEEIKARLNEHIYHLSDETAGGLCSERHDEGER